MPTTREGKPDGENLSAGDHGESQKANLRILPEWASEEGERPDQPFTPAGLITWRHPARRLDDFVVQDGL